MSPAVELLRTRKRFVIADGVLQTGGAPESVFSRGEAKEGRRDRRGGLGPESAKPGRAIGSPAQATRARCDAVICRAYDSGKLGIVGSSLYRPRVSSKGICEPSAVEHQAHLFGIHLHTCSTTVRCLSFHFI